MNRILKKWKFFLLKLVWLKLIKLISPRDFLVKVHKDSFLKKPFVMQSCYFKDQVACNVKKNGW